METCLWCTEFAKSGGSVTQFLNDYCTGVLTPKEIEHANSDFKYCSDCVVVYHQARERVPALHQRLWKLETARLLNFFRDLLELDVEDYDVYLVEDGQERPVPTLTREEFNNRLIFPLMEVLKYPYLLCHRELCEMVVNVLFKMKEINNPLTVQEQYPGTYLLMVHPDEQVRLWALDTARSSGRVDRDKYYDLQEVFSCMFHIIDLGITLDLPNMEDSYCSGKLQMLPPHLYDSQNKKSYWLGICMLLMQLDSQAMDNLLMGPEGQASITQCIINTMCDCNQDDPETEPFWPALHCFLVILDRLGAKVWGQIEPLEAFRAITKAGSYMAEIENIRQKTSSSGQDGTRVKVEPGSHNDPLSCSQIVYDTYTSERSSRSSDCSSSTNDPIGKVIFDEMSSLVNILQSELGQGMRIYGSTFLWFIPFVRSIMELSVINSVFMGEVIHYLDNNVSKDVLYRRTETCDSVTEFFIRILVDIIRLHLSKGYMATMSYFSHIWVDMVILCSTIPDDNCNNKNQDWRGGRRVQMPAVGAGAMSRECVTLIRLLLKEGGRIGTVPESAHFLDLINKHMRVGPTKAWDLSKSQYENLKKCLLKLVKAIADRPAVVNDVPPCAPPTPPSEPSENISYPTSSLTPPIQELQNKDAKVGPSGPIFKDEPLWEHGEYQESFCDSNKKIIMDIKKEPYNPIPISEFRPPIEVSCIKPDLDKVCEIRCVLNDDQKFSRIQAVAKREFEKDVEQYKCSGLEEFGHESVVIPQPSTSQSNISGSAWPSRSSKRKLSDDDEPLDVRRRRLQNSLKPREENSSCARQVSVQLSISAKEVHESSIITISDDEDSSNDKKTENRATCDSSLDFKSPGRDYNNLSESQVFEFETQEPMVSAWDEPHLEIPEPMVSAWDEPHLEIPEVTKIHIGNNSKAGISHDVEPMETQPISDKDIEEACLQVEAQTCQMQHEQGMEVLPKTSCYEKCDFSETKYSSKPPGSTGLFVKGKQSQIRKPPVIEALSQKIKTRRRSHDVIPQDPVKPCSSTMLTSSTVVSPSTIAPLRGSFVSSVAVSSSTPAIVPPKKIRKPVEPKSVAERLGLKKKERKAFELSQRSLDSLGELRSYGQNVHVEPQQKSKRVQQQKPVKKGKNLLASQDKQFFQQISETLHKSDRQNARTPATALVAKSNKCPVPVTLPKTKPINETVKEPSDEEDDDDDDYYLLPCSQPDPDRRMASKMATSEVFASLSNDFKKNPSKWAESNKSKELIFHHNKDAGGSMVKIAESRDENYDDEWTNLTQNEPTDMELCSQVDEEYGENLTAGFVRMDNNSGNQPNGSVGESSPIKSSAGTLQESLSAGAAESSSNDHVFLQPNVPTECQKKAKPSTAKIYPASSRNASLAREMGKPNLLLAANVKTKVTRPPPPTMQPPPTKGTRPTPPTMQPPPTKGTRPPEFRQPLPPRPPHHTNQVSNSSLSTASPAPHVPSYKTYARPEAPVSKLNPTVTQDKKSYYTLKQSDLKNAILEWDFSMFKNYKMFGRPKHNLPYPLKSVPVTFTDYQEYFNIMYPLFLLNTFEEMASEWANKNEKEIIELNLLGIDCTNTSFTGLDVDPERKWLYPKESDLVLLWHTTAYVNDESEFPKQSVHFGFVSSVRGKQSTLNLTIQTREKVFSFNKQSVRCQVVGSLVSMFREFNALYCLEYSKMRDPVLKPDIMFFAPSQEGVSDQDMLEYNEAQAKAILCGVAMVKKKETTPKILLVHGPPGTGKSKIIVGILNKLLPGGGSPVVDRHSMSCRTRILICAPSNAAIDSLMKKIINFFKENCANIHYPQGTCGDINLVRLGNERISEELKGFSLDRQVNKRLEKEREQQTSDLDMQIRRKELDEKIEKLSQQCAKTDKKLPEFKQLNAHKQSLLKEREQLSKKIKELQSERSKVESRLLFDAHVICCTLSGSALLGKYLHGKHLYEKFNYVIIDEAGQAKETETLIPLRYGCHKLILVGDHQQLPPTVKSQKAKELGYDQSLMARLCKSLDHLSTPSSIFLNIQYRMHPDICQFPSKHIYHNGLKNDSETVKKLCAPSWPYEPYRLFDVTDGRESKDGDSFTNLKEAKLVVQLLKVLWKNYPKGMQTRIGVITPYSAQKHCILKALKNEPENQFHQNRCEVDTVDGFQGREKDCIIVSCVRASNKNGSIGFVGNRQRMNVTITRAKYSLFILGHLSTLKAQEDWGLLIQDAENRGTIIKATESNFGMVTHKVLKLVFPARRSSYPPNPPVSTYSERERDHRMPVRPSDPRQLPATHALTHGASDPRCRQNSTRSFHSPSERRQERQSFSSSRTQRM